jgi:CDP-diacylglycerol--glycerol-3-phosphate 3-phosphatidyltransferase/cardiolipin synthase
VQPEGRQGKRALAWADAFTLARLPLAGVFLVVEEPIVRAAALAVAAASDLLDGWLARRYGGSRLGPVLDPVVDKLFMVVGFWVVLRSGLLNPFEILAVLLRDIVALFAFLTTVVLGRPTTLPARAGGKAVTVCQLLTLGAFLTGSELIRPLAWATGAVSLYAIADYMRIGLFTPRKE